MRIFLRTQDYERTKFLLFAMFKLDNLGQHISWKCLNPENVRESESEREREGRERERQRGERERERERE